MGLETSSGFRRSEALESVVLELGGPATRGKLLDRLAEFVAGITIEDVAGRLWIVEPGRIRVRVGKNEADDSGPIELR
jgi:hypothetical protein